MKNTVLASLFATLIFLLGACSTEPVPTNTLEIPLAEEQEFILTPEVETGNLQAASLSATTPRLVVRLSIQPELDKQGNPTGKRYGQAAFFWTDKARSRGGSNLGGTVSIMLRDANDPFVGSAHLSFGAAPIMSNVDLYKQPGYEDHIVKTSATSFAGKVCVEVSSIYLLSTNGYFFRGSGEMTEDYDTKPILSLCEKGSLKSGVDLRLYSLKERMFSVNSGEEFPFTMLVANNGSSPARDVTVSYKIPYAEQLTFIRDESALFDCQATTQASLDEGLIMTVTCRADQVGVGAKGLPLIFSTASDADVYTMLLEFYMGITTSSAETDTTNNTADSFVLLY
jgi:hypothetical protein